MLFRSELFRRYDLKSGALKGVVAIDRERLALSFDHSVWTAGQAEPFRIEFGAGVQKVAPRWRVWIRPFGAPGFRELTLGMGTLNVPEDLAGLYVLRVSSETVPAFYDQDGHRLETVIEVRRPNSRGTATVLTPLNRVY